VRRRTVWKVATNAVLGPEQRGQLQAGLVQEHVDRALALGVDGRGVCHQAHLVGAQDATDLVDVVPETRDRVMTRRRNQTVRRQVDGSEGKEPAVGTEVHG